MNGVEILATEQVATASEFNWTAFWVTVGIITLVSSLIGVVLSIDNCDWSYCIIIPLLGGITGGTMLGVAAGDAVFPSVTEYTKQYKVTISDEVSMNEFMEKYEILNQEGKIYVVKERTGE